MGIRICVSCICMRSMGIRIFVSCICMRGMRIRIFMRGMRIRIYVGGVYITGRIIDVKIALERIRTKFGRRICMAWAIQPCVGIIIKIITCIYVGRVGMRGSTTRINVSHNPAPWFPSATPNRKARLGRNRRVRQQAP